MIMSSGATHRFITSLFSVGGKKRTVFDTTPTHPSYVLSLIPLLSDWAYVGEDKVSLLLLPAPNPSRQLCLLLLLFDWANVGEDKVDHVLDDFRRRVQQVGLCRVCQRHVPCVQK